VICNNIFELQIEQVVEKVVEKIIYVAKPADKVDRGNRNRRNCMPNLRK
jgi:hypothetical protein